MEYCYIGIFSSVFNWVLNKILSPVFNFVAKLLSTILSWVFNEILAPLLEDVLWPLIEMALELVVKILAGVLYGIYSSVLKMVDTLGNAFDYFSGLQNIQYKGQSMTLLEAMFEIDGLRTAFLAIALAGLLLALLLSIIAVIQSSLDLDFENKRPVSRVLSALFKAFIQMFTVELVVYFLVRLSGLLLAGVNVAVGQVGGGSGNTTIGRMIFVVSSMNACTSNKALNLNGSSAAQVGINDSVRKLFYASDGIDYTSLDAVERYFDVAKFDYLIGYALAIFILVVLAVCMIVFVQRIFDILMLYLISPFFVGMIPLDDGEKFGKWRELFIGKCFSGFGMVIIMKLYLMLCPIIMSSNIRFSSSSTELDYMTKMVFLLGGAWSVMKSGSILTSLISSGAAGSEQQTAAVGSAALAGMAGAGLSAAGGLAMMGARKIGEKRQESKNKFDNTRRAKPGLGSSSEGSSFSGSGGSSGSGSTGSGSTGNAYSGSGVSGSSSGGLGAGSEATSGSSSGSGGSLGTGGEAISSGSGSSGSAYSGSGGSGGSTGGQKPEKRRKPVQVGTGLLGFKTYKNPDGSVTCSFRPGKGKLFNCGKDGNGNTNIKILGFGVRLGSDGKVNKFSLPCVRSKVGADGKFHVDRVRVLGTTKKRNNSTGKMYYRDVNLLGYHAKVDKDGNKVVKSGAFGIFKREKQEDGQYHLTSMGFGLIKTNYAKDEDGKLRLSGLRVLGSNLYTRDDVAERNAKAKKAGGSQ